MSVTAEVTAPARRLSRQLTSGLARIGRFEPIADLARSPEDGAPAALRVQSRHAGQAHFMLILRSDGDAGIEERKRLERRRALELGIPVYDEVPAAASALGAVRTHESFVNSRRAAGGAAST